jgi:hypothetical protein
MPRRPTEKAARLTGAQIDDLLNLPEPALRDALQRLKLQTAPTAQTRQQQIVEGLEAAEWLESRRAGVEAALAAASVPDLVAALQSRAVQGDDDGEK